MRYVISCVVAALALSGVLWASPAEARGGDPRGGKKKEKEKKHVNPRKVASPAVVAEKVWVLPDLLREISGLAWLDKDRFACVQDEEGKIFIYNTAKRSVERTINFGPPGDYEDITLVGKSAWVIRSDGQLFEVDDIDAPKAVVRSHNTIFTVQHNMESLWYDHRNQRLLLAVKNKDLRSARYKGVYAFDLRKKKMVAEPVYKIDVDDPLLIEASGGRIRPAAPSGIALHPKTGELYVLDGPSSGLMIIAASGKLRQRYALGQLFAKPEGITFSPDGQLYISNEARKHPANIIQLRLSE